MSINTKIIKFRISKEFEKNKELEVLLSNDLGDEITVDWDRYQCLKTLYKQYKNIANLNYYIWCIEQCKREGLSVRAWCKKHGIAMRTFYYMQRKIRLLKRDIFSNHKRVDQ